MMMNYIKCGKCNCEYNPYEHNGCPQCGAGGTFASGGTTGVELYGIFPHQWNAMEDEINNNKE